MAAASSSHSVAPRRKVSRHRGEGQWAAGHLTPLNGNEQLKKDDDGLNVRTRIETIYSKRGFHSIDPNDLRGRFRWWGLYTQRRPGIDGGRTGLLEPEELEDEYFMMRVRVTGGRLTTEQLRVIGEVSQTYARGSADITDRQNIQFHWVRIEDVPAIWERLESVGLSTTEACGDCRAACSAPRSPGWPRTRSSTARPRWRRSPAATSATRASPTCRASTRRPSPAPRCSTSPTRSTTSPSSAWSTPSTAPASTCGSAAGCRPTRGSACGWALGARGGRAGGVGGGHLGLPRLRLPAAAQPGPAEFLVADWGAEKFRQVVEDEYLGRKLTDGPAPEMPARVWRDHIGVHRQKDGRFYVGFAPRVGRMDGSLLTKVAELAEEHGSGRVSTTVEQKMIILDVPGDRVDSLVDALEALDLRVKPSPFRRGTMACTGIEFCKLAIVETKERGSELIDELERRLLRSTSRSPSTSTAAPTPAPASRPRTSASRASWSPTTRATRSAATRSTSAAPGPGAVLRPQGPRSEGDFGGAADYIERVLKRFQAERQDGEHFAAWAARASEEALS